MDQPRTHHVPIHLQDHDIEDCGLGAARPTRPALLLGQAPNLHPESLDCSKGGVRAWWRYPALGLAILAVVSILVPAVPASAQAASCPLRVRIEWETLGDPQIGEWGGLGGAAFAADGSIWVSDAMLSRVVRITPDRSFRVVARRGEGPGEVEGPNEITRISRDHMLVLDVGSDAAVRFDVEGRYIGRVRLAGTFPSPKALMALEDGDVLVSGYAEPSGHALHRFDGASGRRVWSAVPPPGEVSNPWALRHVVGGVLARSNDPGSVPLVLASPVMAFEVDILHGAARRLFADPRVIPFIGDDFVSASGQGSSMLVEYRWSYPQVTGVVSDHDRILVAVTRQEEGRSEWLCYDREGHRLSRLEMKRPTEIYELLSEGRFVGAEWSLATGEQKVVVGRVTWR